MVDSFTQISEVQLRLVELTHRHQYRTVNRMDRRGRR
jgi:hypothetical protein